MAKRTPFSRRCEIPSVNHSNVALAVEDVGVRFAVAAKAGTAGEGLAGMRAGLTGPTLLIESVGGHGSSVFLLREIRAGAPSAGKAVE